MSRQKTDDEGLSPVFISTAPTQTPAEFAAAKTEGGQERNSCPKEIARARVVHDLTAEPSPIRRISAVLMMDESAACMQWPASERRARQASSVINRDSDPTYTFSMGIATGLGQSRNATRQWPSGQDTTSTSEDVRSEVCSGALWSRLVSASADEETTAPSGEGRAKV